MILELNHRLETESREHADIQRNYEEKLRVANEENKKLQGLTEAYQKEMRSLEIKLQTCDKEKSNTQEKLKQTEMELDRISCQISNEVGDYLVKIIFFLQKFCLTCLVSSTFKVY